MPCVPITTPTKSGQRVTGYLCYTGEYQPGDPPPSGYREWHEWARVQHKAGLRQVRCGACGLLRFPQEIARTERRTHTAYPTKLDAADKTNAVERKEYFSVCLECEGKQ